jgi:ActR/RegA family two-component response regulator
VGSTARFLVVDDDPTVGRQLARLVRPFGEAVVAGTVSGANALLAAPVSWRGFFVDLGLPDGSGLDVVGAARTACPGARAMVLTGNTDAGMINAVHDLGANYVVKPVDGARIEKFLREVVGPAEAARSRAAATAAVGKVMGPTGPRTREQAPEVMPGTLEGCIARLRELMATRPDPMVRYGVGEIIARIKARPWAYGKGAVAVVAAAIGEDVPSLYRHAAVAECWSEAEVRGLCARKGRDGRGLSWSHIVLLGGVRSAVVRAGLVERVLGQGLSVRELAAFILENRE